MLLSIGTHVSTFAVVKHPAGVQAQRPNTPVLPFGAATKTATFIDTTARIHRGAHVIVGQQTYIAPFVGLDATSGIIRIGNNDDIRDNATIISNPSRSRMNPTSVFIGDSVVVGYGATILGPSSIGAFGSAAKGTKIGANALIDGATIEPGAIVGVLARVGPGVTVPSGFKVLPGMNVTTNAQASDPALGMVVKVSAAEAKNIKNELSNSAELAAGYTTLYQGRLRDRTELRQFLKAGLQRQPDHRRRERAEPGSPP